MKRITWIAIVLLAPLGACTSHTPTHMPTTEVASSPVVPASLEPVIVRLVGRHETITISAGAGHSIYSATDAAGKTIVSRATLDELKSSHPDIYKRVSPGVTAYAGMETGSILE